MIYHADTRNSTLTQSSTQKIARTTSMLELKKFQSQARYFFTSNQFAELTGRDPDSAATKSALARLSKAKEIASISKQSGGWVIIPPEYAHYGAPPVDWWLHDFMTTIDSGYYIGLLSAARYWGSTHYALQDTQIVSSFTRRPINVGKSKLVFFTKSRSNQTPTIELSTKISKVNVSTREATLLDLIHYQTKAGGIESVSRIAKDFEKHLAPQELLKALDALDNVSAAQRLGFIFDTLQMRIFANVVESWVHKKNMQFVFLSTGKKHASPLDSIKNLRWLVRYTDSDLINIREQV